MPATSSYVDACSFCEGHLSMVLPLNATPPANEIVSTYNPDNELYPLNLMRCNSCDHLQLDTEISKFRLFKHYVYTSNTSSSNYHYFSQYAKEMDNKFSPRFVVDIGSNDGMFLHFFQQAGARVLGVDPAENIAEIANNNNIPTKVAFFNEMTATNIKQHHGQADLITCNNMFAHNRNLHEVLLGVNTLLDSEGTFVFEVSYALKMLERNLFDLIYHEHFHYHHLKPLISYLNKFNLTIYDAEVIEQTHGGSLRVYAKKRNHQYHKTDRLQSLLRTEDYQFDQSIFNFQQQVPDLRTKVLSLLHDLKANGKQVSVLGYPAKMCTVSYYLGLDSNLINKIYDNNVLKIGKYSHLGFQIEPDLNVVKDKPDYLLLGSWNYKDDILKRFTFFTSGGGRFIVPLPTLEVVA